METLHISSLQELSTVAKKIISHAQAHAKKDEAFVVGLQGTLGAGKTTLVQIIAQQLGVTMPVVSPTFVIMKRYEIDEESAHPITQLVHIDAYRIESDTEMKPLHFSELLQEAHTLVCIEWAERIKNLLPKETLWVDITLEPEDVRVITFSRYA